MRCTEEEEEEEEEEEGLVCATAELEQSWLERTCSQNSGLSASLEEKEFKKMLL